MAKKSSSVGKALRKDRPAKAIGKKRLSVSGSLSLSPAFPEIQDLARTGQHTAAIDLASQKLSAESDTALRMTLLGLRCDSYIALGKFSLAEADASTMHELALPGDPELKILALRYQASVQLVKGGLVEATQTATKAVAQARALKTPNPHLLARCLYTLGECYKSSGNYENAIAAAKEAIPLFEMTGSLQETGRTYWLMAPSYNVLGNAKKSREAAQTALDLCQQAGDSVGIGNAYNALSSTDTDIAERIRHYQQAIQAYETSGYLERVTGAIGNLGFTYAVLGLYMQSCRLTNKALEIDRSIGAKLSMSYWLENLFDTELRLGWVDLARQHLDEFTALSPDFGSSRITVSQYINNGLMALGEDNSAEAVQNFKTAAEMAEKEKAGNLNVVLTYLTYAHLVNNDPKAALEASTQATDLHRKQGYKLPDSFSSQEIWWRHTQALLANYQPTEARAALERAYKFLLEAIANVRDEGLRRNYLNKVAENRELLTFWVEDSLKRKLSRKRIFAHLFIESNVREPFKRLTDTSLRLNALHTVGEIHTFIVEEATELSGGERVLFILENNDKYEVAGASLPRGEQVQDVLQSIEPFLTEARLARTVQLILPRELDSSPKRPTRRPPAAMRGQRLSRIIAPLIAQNQIVGYIYADMDSLYGTFTEVDSDMLAMLANQAAVTLDNVNWAQGLEQKVEERTAELRDRVDELAIINSVQAGLASQLDVNSIYELIGEQLRNLFDSQAISIVSFDVERDIRHYHYILEQGQRLDVADAPIPPLSKYIIQQKQPLLINNNFKERLAEIGLRSNTLPGTKPTKSLLRMPILVDGEVKGMIGLDNIDHENAFTDADVRLLTTLASSMSVALEKAQLYQQAEEARAAADAASAAKSVFLANMSHELRTPLNAIIGFTRIVRKKNEEILPEKHLENLDKVLTSAEHLLGLINAVLDIAKIEAGRMEVHAANFNLNALLDQCANIASPLFKPSVSFEKQHSDLPLLVNSDQEKIKQIILNLLSNAAKFTHEGRVTLQAVKVEAQGNQPESVQISVTDTGIGMNEEALGRVFGEFQQADSSTTREYGGTGLGLTISRNLARLLGGDLTATSEPGKGSAFILNVPVQSPQQMENK
jgi:signal transduction histidine kinase